MNETVGPRAIGLTVLLQRIFEQDPCWSFQNDNPSSILGPVLPFVHQPSFQFVFLASLNNWQFWYSLGELLSTCCGRTCDLVNSAVHWTAVILTMWHTVCNEICFIFVFWTLNFSHCWTFLNSSISILIFFMYPRFYCLVIIPKWDWVTFFRVSWCFKLCPASGGGRVYFHVAWGYSLNQKDIQHFVPMWLSPLFSLLTIF